MLNEFIILVIAQAFAVASPGPDFALVLKNTLHNGKSIGIVTAIGIGFGIAVHMTYTLLGVAVIVANSPIIFQAIKTGGALYLLWLAYLSFKSRPTKASDSINTEEQTTIGQSVKSITVSKALKQGFIVNVLNPKATMFFLALFTNIISIETPYWIQTFYGLWLVVYTMLWFSFIAWIFSRNVVRVWYQKQGHYIDWAMGVFLLLIALRLLLN